MRHAVNSPVVSCYIHMLRKWARRVLFLLVGLAVIGGILYAGIQFASIRSADQRAAAIEKHREAQRAQATPPASQAAAPSAAPSADRFASRRAGVTSRCSRVGPLDELSWTRS